MRGRVGYNLSWKNNKINTEAYRLKKYVLRILVALSAMVLALGILSACTGATKEYTISFYDEGKLVGTVTTAGGEEIALPAAAEKDGFTFVGWFFEEEGAGEQLTSDYYVEHALNKNEHVYAYYKAEEVTPPPAAQFTVTFYNGDSVYDTRTGEAGASVTLPTPPKKDGFTFVGWFTQQGGKGEEFTAQSKLTANVSVYAHYTAEEVTPPPAAQYTVTFCYESGGTYTTKQVQEGGTLTLPTAPDKAGYTFVGWFTQQGGKGEQLTTSTKITRSFSVYAHYTATEYTISFYDGSVLKGTVKTAGNERITLVTAAEKPGYTFAGWYFGTNGTGDKLTADYYANKKLTANVSVYAHYTAEEVTPPPAAQYTVTFCYESGGTYTTKQVQEGGTLTLPTAPDKAGYTFVGWFTQQGGKGEQLTTSTKITRSFSVYAHYTATEYTISFYDGSALKGTVKTAGNEQITLVVAAEKPGYTFEGWYFGTNGTGDKLTADYYASKKLTQDVSVYAHYKPTDVPGQSYRVTLQPNNGGIASVDGVKKNFIDTNCIERAPTATKPGYRFTGWYTDKDCKGEPVTFPYVVTHAHTLYAGWELITYTVSFDMHGAPDLPAVSGRISFEEPSTPEWSGHAFVGWYRDAGYSEQAVFPITLTRDITLHAKWVDVSQGVVFIMDGDTITSYRGGTAADAELVIPAKVNGQQVRYIGADAFRGATFLTKLTLPEGLLAIGMGAFSECTNLTQVVFPSTLVALDQAVFSDTGLTSVTLPASVTSVGMQAFANCTSLKTADFSKTALTLLRMNMFVDDAALTTVLLPQNLTAMETGIFTRCASLNSIAMPKTAIDISSTMFDGTAMYKDPANWENGVFYVDSYLVKTAWWGPIDSSTNDDYSNPNYVVRAGTICIASGAFDSKPFLSITLPDGLLRIGDKAFNYCEKLLTVNIPDTVTTVGYKAFNKTKAIETVNGGQYVGKWFLGVSGSPTSLALREGTVGMADCDPAGSGPMPSVETVTLPSSLKYIGKGAFYWSKITSITLPKGLVSIGEKAFYFCKIASVDLGSCTGLTSIGYSAFGALSLTKVCIPASVTTMGELVFNGAKEPLTIHCAVAAKPAGWADRWSEQVSVGGAAITVVWNSLG